MSDLGDFLTGPARVLVSEKFRERLDEMVLGKDPAWREIGHVVGMEIATSEHVPDDEILMVGALRGTLKLDDIAASFETDFDPYKIDLSGGSTIFKARMSMTFEAAPVKIRPSWWHPIQRILWVHHHGPEVPEIVPSGLHYRMLQRPSWLHPIRRTLWVHRNGPHVPEVKVVGGGVSRMTMPMAYISGVT